MTNQKLIIYGAGPFAALLYKYLEYDTSYEVVAFCVDAQYRSCEKFCDLPLVDFDNIEKLYPSNEFSMIVAIGYSSMRMRKVLFDKAKHKGYQLENYIHSSVVNLAASMGDNNIILPGCVIEPNVILGHNNVVWSMTLLGHDCIVGDHNYISAKCLISGDSTVANLCFIGNGVVMVNGLQISNETCVAASSYLRKSTQELGLYAGNPAKLIKYNENGICIK